MLSPMLTPRVALLIQPQTTKPHRNAFAFSSNADGGATERLGTIICW